MLLNDTDWPTILYLSLFSLVIALFYTVIFRFLFKIKRIPVWLFFAVLPILILISGAIYKPAAIITFGCIFFLTFVIGTIRVFYIGMKGWQSDFDEQIKDVKSSIALYGKKNIVKKPRTTATDNKEEVNTKKETPVTKNKITIVFGILFVILFFTAGHFAFILVFVYIAYTYFITKKSTNEFLKLQSILPTSKIRSMAMGLVEIKGKIKVITPILSKIGEKQCIGYIYKVERISRDKDGKESFATIESETICNPFILEDETGAVEISSDNLELIKLDTSDSYRNGNKRYSQKLLLHDTEVLIIGRANNIDQKTIIEKEPVKNIFVLSPTAAVDSWNRNAPLRKKFITYACFVALLIALILFMNVEYNDNMVLISFESTSSNFTQNNIFK